MIGGAARLLVVDDDASVLEALCVALRDEGFLVHGATNAPAAERLAQDLRPDLAILDVRLPAASEGFELGRRLRLHSAIPIVYVTGADGLEDRLAGFRLGADDYIVKPFATAELVARVKAVLRRAGSPALSVWQVEHLTVDEGTHVVTWQDQSIDLTPREFQLLVALVRRPGRVLSKAQLLAEVWGFEGYDPNVVEVHVSALRRKLPLDGNSLIRTVRGVGYVLSTDASS